MLAIWLGNFAVAGACRLQLLKVDVVLGGVANVHQCSQVSLPLLVNSCYPAFAIFFLAVAADDCLAFTKALRAESPALGLFSLKLASGYWGKADALAETPGQ
jgi:hypothetical protein